MSERRIGFDDDSLACQMDVQPFDFVWHPRHLKNVQHGWEFRGKVFENRTIPYYESVDDYKFFSWKAKP